MISKRLLLLLAAALSAIVLNGPQLVSSQHVPPCVNTPTAGKTDKQLQLQDCSCEQAAVSTKPTYRVGAAPFGHRTVARVGARRSQTRAEPENLYDGLQVPDLKDAQSPEVVGLRERVLRAREEARRQVEDSLERARKTLTLDPNNEHANYVLKQPRVRNAYEHFIAVQNSSQWMSLPSFDWRAHGLDMGAVLNQGKCQSCWAFAAVSVYLSSWNVEQLRLGVEFFEVTVPEYYSYQRIPSVQQLLNCIGKDKGDCTSGGWHGTAFAFMVSTHVPHIPDSVVWKKGERARIEEYTGRLSPCTDRLRHREVKRGGQEVVALEGPDSHYRLPTSSDQVLTAYDRALAWGYVNEQNPNELPSVAQLKQALIEHGPLAMPIHGDACFSVYQGGVFNGHSTGDPNHVMVLIGWDDEKQAWLVKNSWGAGWGEQGYSWVAYGSNNIGQFAAWIQPTPVTDDKPVVQEYHP